MYTDLRTWSSYRIEISPSSPLSAPMDVCLLYAAAKTAAKHHLPPQERIALDSDRKQITQQVQTSKNPNFLACCITLHLSGARELLSV